MFTYFMLHPILNNLGGFGPFILFFYSLYLLWEKPTLRFYYIIGYFSNSVINILLKGIIQQPRPLDDEKLFNLAIKNAPKDVFKNGIPFNIFGMPSGHAQSTFFSTVFIYLSLKQKNILLVYLVVSILTAVQRFCNNYHSLLQIIVGDIIGALYALCIYHLAQQKLKGRLREKPDDFGPI